MSQINTNIDNTTDMISGQALAQSASAWFEEICNDSEAMNSFDLDAQTAEFIGADPDTSGRYNREEVRDALARELAICKARVSERLPYITYTTVPCGDARIEGRAPSHDGEYIVVVKLADDMWFATGNGGVITGSDGDWYDGDERTPGYDELQAAAGDAVERWQFDCDPDRFGFEAKDMVAGWLSAPAGRVL
jgi:hypothetical protein